MFLTTTEKGPSTKKERSRALKNKKDSDGVIIVRQPPENACGGTTETIDTRAPKEISSKDIVFFSVTSKLGYVQDGEGEDDPLMYVSAYAVPGENGSFLFYEYCRDRGYDRPECSWAFVGENVAGKLCKLTEECGLAGDNGHHSRTHGLPEDFGGRVLIEYAGGEKISFSNNQCPIISRETGEKIHRLFAKLLKLKPVKLPSPDRIVEIAFREDRRDGGYTESHLSISPDGTGVNRKKANYGDAKVYVSEKPVDKDTVAAIKNNIEKTGLLAWTVMPEDHYEWSSKKKITFTFDDGGEITVDGSKRAPDRIRNGFFNVELEVTTKH